MARVARVAGAVALAKIGVNTGKSVANTAKKVPGAIPKNKQELRAAGRGVLNAGAAVPKNIVKSTFKDVVGKDGLPDKKLGNFYTGKKINPIHLGVGGAAAIGGSFMVGGANSHYKEPLRLATMNNYQEYGAPDVMSYDGVSQGSSTPRNLNATGDIVFGLHNGRKG